MATSLTSKTVAHPCSSPKGEGIARGAGGEIKANALGSSSLFAVRRDKCQFRKISAIASRAAGEQGSARDARVRSDKEVRQRRGPRAASAAIQPESLRRAEGGGFGYFSQRQIELLDLRVTVRLGFKPNRKLRIDDRVDQQWARAWAATIA